MNYFELAAFIAYFVLVLGVGIFFFVKSKDQNEKDYFLGGRNMGGMVAALSAGASDMSAWVLMGLPGAIYLFGLGQVWISIGLLVGTVCAWIFIAPRLRRFAIKAGDAITVPEFFSNRFKAKNPVLRITCAVIFVIAYCIYAASSISACGDLFTTLIPGFDRTLTMVIFAVVILVYTLLGGFNAVCWTDFFQGLLMLAALMIVPIIALFMLNSSGPVGENVMVENYYNLLSSGKFDWKSVSDIISGFGWGLGYFGMPHIVVRYMSIKSEKEMKKSQKIGIGWFLGIIIFATAVGIIGREFLGSDLANEDMVFVNMVREIFKYGALALIGGIFLSAIIAAAMSTADSQLLASSSSFASDIYKTAIKKDASDKEMLWVGRITVVVILVVALLIAINPNSGGIMALVESAWAIFGAAFSPAMILCLFWKRFNYKGACAGIITGFVVSVFWMFAFNKGDASWIVNTNLYEIVPGFILGFIASVVVTLTTKAPEKEVVELYESVGNYVPGEGDVPAISVAEEPVLDTKAE